LNQQKIQCQISKKADIESDNLTAITDSSVMKVNQTMQLKLDLYSGSFREPKTEDDWKLRTKGDSIQLGEFVRLKIQLEDETMTIENNTNFK
jgi:hypothetical protein